MNGLKTPETPADRPASADADRAARVFISSTSEDLAAHREAARDAAVGARMLPIMMEYFVASGEHPPLEACLSQVSEADLLVVVVAHRYGWVPPDQGADQPKSITWLECEQAVSEGKEVLAFLVDEKEAWPEEAREAYRLTAAIQNRSANGALYGEVNRNVGMLKQFKAWLNGRGIRARSRPPNTFGVASRMRYTIGGGDSWPSRQPGRARNSLSRRGPRGSTAI